MQRVIGRRQAGTRAYTKERYKVTAGKSIVSGVPGRYATALFELARDAGTIEQVGAGLAGFSSMMDASQDLQRLVRSPVFSASQQIAALDSLFAKSKTGGLAANFIKLAAANRRLFAIAAMIKAYQTLVADAKGEVTAEVTSAEKLSAGQLASLKKALKASMGRDVQVDAKVDPSILGGLIVMVGSRMFDNSLKTKLQNLQVAMKGSR